MSSINQSSSSSKSEGQEVDKTFMQVIHEAAEGIGSTQGRKYIAITEGKLGLTPMKSREVDSFKTLITYVSKQMEELQKLQALTEQEIATITNDLSKINAEYEHLKGVSGAKSLNTDMISVIAGHLNPKEVAGAEQISKK